MQKRRLPGAGFVVVTVLLLGAGLRAEMQTPQQTTSQQTPTPGLGSSSSPLGAASGEVGIDEASMARMKHRQEAAGLDERHRHMVTDADKLLQLATELKAEVEKSSKNETSVSAYNKADAIERLAHDVKQRLKN